MPDIITFDVDVLLTAEHYTVYKGYVKALEQSSGKFTRKRLAKLGYPYAERKGGEGVPYNDPAKINIQKGEFYLDWKVTLPNQQANGVISSKITNVAPYADKLELGIPGLTIPRPLIQRIMPVIEYWRERNIYKFLLRGFRAP